MFSPVLDSAGQSHPITNIHSPQSALFHCGYQIPCLTTAKDYVPLLVMDSDQGENIALSGLSDVGVGGCWQWLA